MIQNLITGFLVGFGVGGMGVLVYVGHKNKAYETYVKQVITEHNQLVGRYTELEQRYSVMQATKAATKIGATTTQPVASPRMSWINDDDGRNNYERFGPEQ